MRKPNSPQCNLTDHILGRSATEANARGFYDERNCDQAHALAIEPADISGPLIRLSSKSAAEFIQRPDIRKPKNEHGRTGFMWSAKCRPYRTD